MLNPSVTEIIETYHATKIVVVCTEMSTGINVLLGVGGITSVANMTLIVIRMFSLHTLRKLSKLCWISEGQCNRTRPSLLIE